MKKFRVFGTAQVNVSCVVEADSPEEAMEKADDKFGGISGFCGNGGTDKLIGVHGSKESISSEDVSVDWDESVEI